MNFSEIWIDIKDIFFHENVFENVCKMATILRKLQSVQGKSIHFS